MIRALAIALGIAGVFACTHSSSTLSSSSPTSSAHDEARAVLATFSGQLARAGMSIPLPARVCDEDGDVPVRWRADPGCIELERGVDVNERALLRAYAEAIVHVRLPSSTPAETDARSNALVEAYFAHDDAKLAQVARNFEAEFDAFRSKKPKSERVVHREPVHNDVVDAGPASPHGEHAHVAQAEVTDAGTASESGHASPADAGPAVLSTREKLIGTWTYEGGPIRNVYAMCSDAKYAVRFEIVDPSFDFAADDLPTVHGTWSVTDGDPPKVTFTSQGESVDAPVSKLDEDAIDVTIENEELHLTRRSKTASCD